MAAVMCILPAGAAASPLRLLAARVVALESDGSRYVAWQTQAGAQVLVFDTRTRAQQRVSLPGGCQLASEEERRYGRYAAAGRFLATCTGAHSLENGLLDGRDGRVTPLSQGLLSAVDWLAVGTRYVLGGSQASTCTQTRLEQAFWEQHLGLPCLALYDLASGRVSYRPPSLWPDIDRAGAPAICPRLRAKVLAEERIGGVERQFDYSARRFARPAKNRRYIEINRCKSHPTILASGSEEPENFDLRGGLLSWDTAHPPSDLPTIQENDTTHNTLGVYSLSNKRHHHWTLPRVSVTELSQNDSIPAVLGYSTHTASMVLWIATRTAEIGRDGVEVKTSSVYAAPLG